MTRLRLQKSQAEAIKNHIDEQPEVEVCGLIGGVWQPFDEVALAYSVIAIQNADPQPASRYHMSPVQQLKALLEFERQGWDVVGIYHSHPHGEAVPSPTDIAEATYPDALYLIGVPHGNLRLWRIRGGEAQEVELETLEE